MTSIIITSCNTDDIESCENAESVPNFPKFVISFVDDNNSQLEATNYSQLQELNPDISIDSINKNTISLEYLLDSDSPLIFNWSVTDTDTLSVNFYMTNPDDNECKFSWHEIETYSFNSVTQISNEFTIIK